MHKPSVIMSVLLTVLIPVAILLLSSNLVLRMPLTNDFYFNDSQTLDEIDYSITVSDMGSAIGKYFSMPGSADFQVYEKNGKYKDTVFTTSEQKVMKKAKDFLFRQFLVALGILILAMLIYANTSRKGLRDLLRYESWIAMGGTVFLLILQLVLIGHKSFRAMLYGAFIGSGLSKTSTLYIILGGGKIYSIYLMFSSIAMIVLLLLFIYLNYKHTKPDRIFYARGF